MSDELNLATMCGLEQRVFDRQYIHVRTLLVLKVIHSKKNCFGECYTYFGCEAKTGVVRILVIFQDRLMFSYIIQNVSTRAFH